MVFTSLETEVISHTKDNFRRKSGQYKRICSPEEVLQFPSDVLFPSRCLVNATAMMSMTMALLWDIGMLKGPSVSDYCERELQSMSSVPRKLGDHT